MKKRNILLLREYVSNKNNSLITSILNVIESNYKYLIFGIWLHNPD